MIRRFTSGPKPDERVAVFMATVSSASTRRP